MSEHITAWLDAQRHTCDMQVAEISLGASREWAHHDGRLVHRSGGFFSVVGATVSVNGEPERSLDQPLILQPEIGILGFIIRRVANEPWLLVQAKPEPGNVMRVQAAPSVQATESNYLRRHGGAPTPHLAVFREPAPCSVLADSLQSEQGTRFLGKYNRNMMVEVAADESIGESAALRWFPMREVLALLATDFQINTDARSVLASTPWQALSPAGTPFGGGNGDVALRATLRRSYEAGQGRPTPGARQALARLRSAQANAAWRMQRIDLENLQGWQLDDRGLRADRPRCFDVRQFRIETTQREVPAWDQPLIGMATQGEVVLLGQERDGVLQFAFRPSAEVGFRERCQFGPTLQDLGEPGFDDAWDSDTAAQLAQISARAAPLLQCRHSDEGGRFHRCISRYEIRIAPGTEPIGHDDLVWMNLGEIEALIGIPGTFSNEARSAISMLLAYL